MAELAKYWETNADGTGLQRIELPKEVAAWTILYENLRARGLSLDEIKLIWSKAT